MPGKKSAVRFIKGELAKSERLIQEIEQIQGSRILVLFCGDYSIDRITAYRLHKILRKLENLKELSLFLESGGGDIDAACKIVKILRNFSEGYSVMIPSFCKSAATLIALGADKQIMCKASELGIADPQVRDPITGMWVPAHSIKEAIDFIEETKDPLVKLSLADKLPPLLIGAFRDAQNAAEQYVQEALEKLGKKKKEAIHMFTKKFLSHGYPIDRDMCKEVGLPIVYPDKQLEEKICALYEIYGDLTLSLLNEYEAKKILIIQANHQRCVVVDETDMSPQFKPHKKVVKSKSPPPK